MASDTDKGLFKQPLLNVFKQKGRLFFSLLRDIVDLLPNNTIVTKFDLVDWPYVEWENWNGACTLIGDTTYCIVICKFICP